MTDSHEALDGELARALPIDPDLITDEPEAVRRDPYRHRSAQRTILLVVGCAGALGALARYGVGRLLPMSAGHFPWGTFWVNLTGSAAAGFVLVLLTERFPRARLARPLVATGFLGAYTTYSTYMVDTDLLFRAHDIVTGAVYALTSLVTGICAVLAGVVLARFVVRLDHRLNEQLS